MQKKYTTALFDVDGTLITLDGVVKAVQEAMAHLDLKAMDSKDIIHRFVGRLLITEFSRLYPHIADQAEEFEKIYSAFFIRHHKKYSRLQPYVKEVFKELEGNRVRIGIVTTKGRKEALAVLNDYGLHYDVLISHNEVPAIKPSPIPLLEAMTALKANAQQTIMTGDHIFDVMAAKSADCDGVGVLTGASTKDELEEAGAMFVIKDLSELPKILGLE